MQQSVPLRPFSIPYDYETKSSDELRGIYMDLLRHEQRKETNIIHRIKRIRSEKVSFNVFYNRQAPSQMFQSISDTTSAVSTCISERV